MKNTDGGTIYYKTLANAIRVSNIDMDRRGRWSMKKTIIISVLIIVIFCAILITQVATTPKVGDAEYLRIAKVLNSMNAKPCSLDRIKGGYRCEVIHQENGVTTIYYFK